MSGPRRGDKTESPPRRLLGDLGATVEARRRRIEALMTSVEEARAHAAPGPTSTLSSSGGGGGGSGRRPRTPPDTGRGGAGSAPQTPPAQTSRGEMPPFPQTPYPTSVRTEKPSRALPCRNLQEMWERDHPPQPPQQQAGRRDHEHRSQPRDQPLYRSSYDGGTAQTHAGGQGLNNSSQPSRQQGLLPSPMPRFPKDTSKK